MKIPNIFDLTKDANGVLRMPFNPDGYSTIFGRCDGCGNSFPCGEMKRLQEGGKAIFFCKGCWFSSPISDAGNWVG